MSDLYSTVGPTSLTFLPQERKETYPSTRAHAALYMRTHPDDFLPFLESENDADGIMSPGTFLGAISSVRHLC